MIKILKEACIGCGACQAALPEVFGFDDDGLATVNNDAITEEMTTAIDDVIDDCPTGAIVKE